MTPSVRHFIQKYNLYEIYIILIIYIYLIYILYICIILCVHSHRFIWKNNTKLLIVVNFLLGKRIEFSQGWEYCFSLYCMILAYHLNFL